MKKNFVKGVACAVALASVTATPVMTALQPVMVMADTVVPEASTNIGTINVIKKDTTAAHNAVAGAQYTAYKVMSLTPGQNAGEWAEYDVITKYSTILAGITADNLGNYSATEMEALVNSLEFEARTDTAGIKSTTTGANGTASFNNLELGWYLIVETTTPAGVIAGRPFLIAVPSTNNIVDPNGEATVGTEWIYEVTATPKATAISVDKNITNAKAAKDSAFVIGNTIYTGKNDTVALYDYVEYTIESVVPEYADTYFHNGVSPKFVFTDTLSDGLTIQNTVDYPITITIDDTAVPETENGNANYNIAATATDDDTTADMTITFTNEFLNNDAYRGKAITIKYFVQVNENAVMGTAGNTNDVKFTYNSQPQTEVTISPVEDAPDTYVYTYGIAVDKFAEDTAKTPLSGAKFKLYKDVDLSDALKDADGEEIELTTDDNGALAFERLDAGTYYLKETQSPAGYSLLTNPIKVEIIPTTDADGKITSGEFTLKVDGTAITATTGNQVTKLSTADGVATVAVMNHAGFTLPTTGGTGIALTIAIAGCGLVLLMVMMVKNKKNAAE